MAWWKKLVSRNSAEEEVDFYKEGVELLNAGKYHEALTSFRLALREAPDDDAVLQQIAITYTRIGMTDEAIKTYRTALQKNASAVGAHYGMAFLKLREGKTEEAIEHLRAFLASPPSEPEAMEHVSHARKTLAQLTGEPVDTIPATSNGYGQTDPPAT
ncbi:MAG TPA: tetratricopeptide repeat protein [Longimicrobiales bacterium]|nr:tetratricopeptide repeat protein [Longimicrobiales bacterium]